MAAFYDHFPVPCWIAGVVLAIVLCGVVRYFVSGWALLARRFRTGRPQPAYAGFATVSFRRIVHFKRTINLASDIDGVYLAFWPAVGLAPLFIPWAEIEFLPRFRWMFVRYQPLRLGLEEHVRCTLFARQADVLLRDANREPIEKIPDLGFGLNPRLPVYTTPRLPAPVIVRR